MVCVFVNCLDQLLSWSQAGGDLGGTSRLPAKGAATFLAFAGRGPQLQGIASNGAVLGRIDLVAVEHLAVKLPVNSFNGALSHANVLRIEPVFDPRHQRLSFSSLTSLLHGFVEIGRRLACRINAYAPLSAYAEARHFHPLPHRRLAIRTLVTRQAALGFFRHGDVATVALDPAFLLCTPKFRTCSIRTPLRLFLAVAAISRIACAPRRRRRERDAAPPSTAVDPAA